MEISLTQKCGIAICVLISSIGILTAKELGYPLWDVNITLAKIFVFLSVIYISYLLFSISMPFDFIWNEKKR